MRHIVSSSNITAVDYDPDAKTLIVEFKGSGKKYQYSDVPQEAVDSLLAADSVGKHFNAVIRAAYKGVPV